MPEPGTPRLRRLLGPRGTTGRPADIFRGARILEFSADCPALRLKVASVGEEIATLEETMQRLVDRTRNFGKRGTQFCDEGRAYADEINAYTRTDHTVYFTTSVLPEHFTKVVGYESQRLARLDISSQCFEKGPRSRL